MVVNYISRMLIISALVFNVSVAGAKAIDVITINDPITPVIAEYVMRAIDESEAARAVCLIIQMDTPGGLDLAMRDIIKSMLAAEIPIVVYVSPGGARAASAGALITLAAHVAVMAPGTNIGAASPVALGGGQMDETMAAKIKNDAAAYVESLAAKRNKNKEWAIKAVRESVSISEKEALEINVIDLISPTIDMLVQDINGREVETALGRVTIDTSDATLTYKNMGLRENILKALANPNIAYILFLAGLAGLYFEFSNPGAIFPGVIGGISLILAFYSMQTLSANYAGVLLILLGVVLFIIELKIVSYGLLTIAGIVSLTLGSLMLFDASVPYLRVSLSVILPTVILVSAVFILAITLVVQAQRRKTATGNEGLIGSVGNAVSTLAPLGKVFVHGEYWNARSNQPIAQGAKVRVISVEGMTITVEEITGTLAR